MLTAEVLSILRCPDDGSPLAPAGDALVNKLNAAIRDRRITNRAGKRVERAMDGGLVRADGALLYPIVDDIPILLRDDAVPLDQVSESPARNATG